MHRKSGKFVINAILFYRYELTINLKNDNGLTTKSFIISSTAIHTSMIDTCWIYSQHLAAINEGNLIVSFQFLIIPAMLTTVQPFDRFIVLNRTH